MHEIVRQIHHLAETMVHHGQTAIGGEHAEAVRHVVERGVELAGERRLPKTRCQRLHENRIEAEIDVLQPDEEENQQRGEGEIEESAVQRQRQRHRSAGEQDVQLDQLRTAVIAGRAAGRIADRRRHADHVRDWIVAAEDGDETPGAENAGIENGADPVTRFPVLGLGVGQHGGAAFIFAHLPGARGADHHDQRGDRP
jgi:hypothetical protein